MENKWEPPFAETKMRFVERVRKQPPTTDTPWAHKDDVIPVYPEYLTRGSFLSLSPNKQLGLQCRWLL